MNRCFCYVLPMLVSVGLLLGGCATTGPSVPSYDPNKPRTFLSGGEVQHAKSVAMGSAVSKGWKIVDSSGNRLVARRPLDATAAESLVGESVSTASVEVTTDFYQRQGGVEVVVDAALLTDVGEETEKRIDFTESYRDELNSSLNSLGRAWDGNRQRVASGAPPLPTRGAVPGGESSERASTTVEGEGTAGPVGQTASQDGADRAWPEPGAPHVAPVAASNADDRVAPVEDRYSAATPRPLPAPGNTVPGGSANDMLVLNRAAEPGVWAYYAEHYARIQGCAVSDSGAVLEEKTPEHEIHRVYCDDGQSFRVSCNAGTCRGIQ